MNLVRVTSLDELRGLPNAVLRLLLNGGAYTRYKTRWDAKSQTWLVHHYFDGRSRAYSDEQLAADTNLVKGLECGALWRES